MDGEAYLTVLQRSYRCPLLRGRCRSCTHHTSSFSHIKYDTKSHLSFFICRLQERHKVTHGLVYSAVFKCDSKSHLKTRHVNYGITAYQGDSVTVLHHYAHNTCEASLYQNDRGLLLQHIYLPLSLPILTPVYV